MPTKKPGYRRRIPKDLRDVGCRERTLHDVFMRALAVTSTMDAERHIILAVTFAYVFEVPLPKFTFALRKYKRRAEASSLIGDGSKGDLAKLYASLAARGRPPKVV